MKAIDLLNKIANGKEVPAKIKFRNNIFRYSSCNYYCDEMHTTLFSIYSFSILNDEIEIIEENKKLKHLESYSGFENLTNEGKLDYLYEMITRVIDEVQELEDK